MDTKAKEVPAANSGSFEKKKNQYRSQDESTTSPHQNTINSSSYPERKKNCFNQVIFF